MRIVIRAAPDSSDDDETPTRGHGSPVVQDVEDLDNEC
jgi:hypothetical protein